MKRVNRQIWLLLALSLAQAATALAALQQRPDLLSKGTTYNRAQATAWLDTDKFAAARWDGTLSIFRPPFSPTEYGPVLVQVLMSPSAKGIEMIIPISQNVFITSNDESSLAIWINKNSKYTLAGIPQYDSKYGVANCASSLERAGNHWLITGHSEGYVLIWKLTDLKLSLKQAISMRSPDPITSPYKLWNVRGIAVWKNGIVATGAEDGDICLLSVPDGKILTRIRFNPAAQRGINSLSIFKDYLIVANCSVGPNDKNLWLYRLENSQITLIDSINLLKDISLPQAYNFSVQLAPIGEGIYFLASTQEGLLWLGSIMKDKLAVITNKKIACDGGAAIAFQPKTWMLSVIAFDITLFTVPINPNK